MSYRPGEGYDKGYSARMSGGQLPVQASGGSSDPYWQEYTTGWRDADTKIIKEARERNACLNEDNKSKTFIQD
jgi:hypothetical protein